MEQLDRSEVVAALHEARGNIGKAARLLHCSRRTLQNRMRYYGMPAGRSGRPRRHLKRRHAGGVAVLGLGAAVGLGALLLAGRSRV